MATQPNNSGKVLAFPGTAPMLAVVRILARFERGQIEAFLAVAIDLLDVIDGDADLEAADSDEDDDPAEEGDDDTSCDDYGIDDADQGDLEDDCARSMPQPIYGDDQTIVLGKSPFGVTEVYRH